FHDTEIIQNGRAFELLVAYLSAVPAALEAAAAPERIDTLDEVVLMQFHVSRTVYGYDWARDQVKRRDTKVRGTLAALEAASHEAGRVGLAARLGLLAWDRAAKRMIPVNLRRNREEGK